ncbi:DUF5658 family protein [Tritonibacter mobilis]|uniref:DUF5658 family protein n=1 Tax=Tritonibacter mobilis TaxID=379347 RepID=UPI0009BECFE7|nr:DUF5658 family protein [Tritonibacter mobilis]
MIYALIAFALAQLADIVSTTKALKSSDTREANPVVRWMMDRFGRGWIILKVVVSGGAAFLLWKTGFEFGIWAMAALTAWVAYRNMRFVK